MSNAMRWWLAILAGLNFIVSGGTLGNYIDPKIAGLIGMGVGALMVGTSVYKTGSAKGSDDVEP